MPHRTIKGKTTRKQQLPMPRDSDDSEVDEFETERRQRGMYDDSDEEFDGDLPKEYSDDSENGDEGSEAESSEMARQRWQGWQADELDGQEEEFTEESDGDEEEGSEDDSAEEGPRRKSRSVQDRLASLRKGERSCSRPMYSLV